MNRDTKPDCLRSLSPEEYAAVPVPTREEVRAILDRMRADLRAAAMAPRPMPRGSGRWHR